MADDGSRILRRNRPGMKAQVCIVFLNLMPKNIWSIKAVSF